VFKHIHSVGLAAAAQNRTIRSWKKNQKGRLNSRTTS